MLTADGKEFIEKLERGNKAMTYHLSPIDYIYFFISGIS
jgi:hypothetical protein